MTSVLRVALVGFGRMGHQHAETYAAAKEFEVVAICGRPRQQAEISALHPDVQFFTRYDEMLAQAEADIICISTHVDTHNEFARKALDKHCHVFLEKPATTSHAQTLELLGYAEERKRKLIIGYILQYDRLWDAFIEQCKTLHRPFKLICHLDQHSSGEEWEVHRKILAYSSISRDCAVHFFDVFAQAIDFAPRTVSATERNTHNDSSLHNNFVDVSVDFTDGSTGRYRSAWGPGFDDESISNIQAVSREKAIAIVDRPDCTDVLCIAQGGVEDIVYSESGHVAHAAVRQQTFVHECIRDDLSLAEHHTRVLLSMKLAELADESARTGQTLTYVEDSSDPG